MSLKKLIAEKFGVKPRISMAGLGMLDVFLDGKQIFSYREAGHMPKDEEIVALIREKTGISPRTSTGERGSTAENPGSPAR